MKKQILILAGVVFALCMGSCSKEDTPQLEEEDQTQDELALWDGETPHTFYYDIEGVKVNVNEDGYMLFPKRVNGVPQSETVDYLVIKKKYGYPHKAPKEFAVSGPTECRRFSFVGKKATPWSNVEVYKQMCRTIGFRPDSKHNDFEELSDLPVRAMKFGPWNMTLETVVSVDIVTHKYFDKNHPAEVL